MLYSTFIESAGGVLPAFADLPTEGCTFGFDGWNKQQIVEAFHSSATELSQNQYVRKT